MCLKELIKYNIVAVTEFAKAKYINENPSFA